MADPQSTLDNKYVKRQRLPDYMTAMKMADDAEIGYGEMLSTLAQEEEKRKVLADSEKSSYNASSLETQRGALAQLVEQRTLKSIISKDKKSSAFCLLVSRKHTHRHYRTLRH